MVQCIILILLRIFNNSTVTNFGISTNELQLIDRYKIRNSLIKISAIINGFYYFYTNPFDSKDTQSTVMSFYSYIITLKFVLSELLCLAKGKQVMKMVQALLEENFLEYRKWSKICLIQICSLIVVLILFNSLKLYFLFSESVSISPFRITQTLSYTYVAFHYLSRIVFMEFVACLFISRLDWLQDNYLTHEKSYQIYYETSQLILSFNHIIGPELALTVLAQVLQLGATSFSVLVTEQYYENGILMTLYIVSTFMLCLAFHTVEDKVNKMNIIKNFWA